MKYISIDDALIIHEYQIKHFGGGPGIRDEGLVESAVFRPQSTFDGNDLYPTLYEKAAALGCSIINNHPFGDGNKRTGLHTMLVFLELNGIESNFTEDALVELGMGIASDEIEEKKVVEILKKYCFEHK